MQWYYLHTNILPFQIKFPKCCLKSPCLHYIGSNVFESIRTAKTLYLILLKPFWYLQTKTKQTSPKESENLEIQGISYALKTHRKIHTYYKLTQSCNVS